MSVRSSERAILVAFRMIRLSKYQDSSLKLVPSKTRMPANRPDLLDTVLASVHPTDTCIFVWLAEIIFDIIATMHVGQELRTNHPGGSSNDKTFKIPRFVSRIGVVENQDACQSAGPPGYGSGFDTSNRNLYIYLTCKTSF
jgi:hypothetical protein